LDVDPETEERDDAIIGIALRRSIVVIAVVAAAVGAIIYFARPRAPQAAS
jgi:hypothetical protein